MPAEFAATLAASLSKPDSLLRFPQPISAPAATILMSCLQEAEFAATLAATLSKPDSLCNIPQ